MNIIENMQDVWVRGSTQGSYKQWSAHVVAFMEPYDEDDFRGLHRKACLIIVDFDTINNCLKVKSANWYFTSTAKIKEGFDNEQSYTLELTVKQKQQLFDAVMKSEHVNYLKKTLAKRKIEIQEFHQQYLVRYENSQKTLNEFIEKIPNNQIKGIL